MTGISRTDPVLGWSSVSKSILSIVCMYLSDMLNELCVVLGKYVGVLWSLHSQSEMNQLWPRNVMQDPVFKGLIHCFEVLLAGLMLSYLTSQSEAVSLSSNLSKALSC